MANEYIAITIGPISDTMNLVTKPGALWLSSFVFSYVSKNLCERIAGYIGNDAIISPYIPDGGTDEYAELMTRDDGIGLFHDHIICRYDERVWKDFADIKSKVIDDVALKTNTNKDELKKYIMIAACKVTAENGKNAIKASSAALDALELPKVFNPMEKANPFIGSLVNKEEKAIAGSFGINSDKWGLARRGGKETVFEDIGSIAANKVSKGYKKNNYFCILRSDGDNISKIINSLNTDADCRSFSKVCLGYCCEVAEKVKAYGGITIYAGGDDLFALIPCESESGTVCTLIQSIIGIFNKHFEKYIDAVKAKNEALSDGDKLDIPSLSFGAMICHKKHPLYEAVATSGDLLFGIAKEKNGGKKNCTVFHLQKHSGQSERFLVLNSAMDKLSSMLSDIITAKTRENDDADGGTEEKEDKEAYLLSAAHKLMLHQVLLDCLKTADSVENAFKNIFDASSHIDVYETFLHKTLPSFYTDYCTNGSIVLFEKDKELKDKYTKTLAQVLRFIKFFVEKGEE